MAAPWMTADFEQVKNLHYSKTPLRETRYLSNFLGYLSMLPTFLDCSGIQFFDSPPFSLHSQLGYPWLPTPHCAVLM